MKPDQKETLRARLTRVRCQEEEAGKNLDQGNGYEDCERDEGKLRSISVVCTMKPHSLSEGVVCSDGERFR